MMHRDKWRGRKSVIRIISPHIDDAVLSLGGLIQKHSTIHSFCVVNVFSRSTWTNPTISNNNPPSGSVPELRKKEDINVSRFLNYKVEFFDFDDFPLRDPDKEMDVLVAVKKALVASSSRDDLLYFPIGIDHPDHILLREIGFEMMSDFNVCFYEDMPYASQNAYKYQSVFRLLRKNRLEPVSIEVDNVSKTAALRMYESQVSSDWLKDITNYSYNVCDDRFYERFWKPDDKSSPFQEGAVK